MTEPAQPTVTFELKDVLIALIRQRGLHEGIWSLGVEFGFGAANFGPTQENVYPSAFAQVQKLGLIQADAEGALAVDAAKVNPGARSVKKPAPSAKVKVEETSKPSRASGKELKKK